MLSKPLKVADFLELPIIRAGLPKLVAGRGGLEAEVRWVHTLDVPDVSDLLRGGEMVLSTGVSLGPKPFDQRRFIADLATEGAVGAAFELGYSWGDELPAAMIEEADRLELPLIALHRKLRFVEVTESVNGTLLESGHALLRRGEDLHRRLDAIVLRGGGAEEILAELSSLISNPVLLEDAGGELVAQAASRQTEADLLDAWSSIRWRGSGAGEADGAMAAEVSVRGRVWGRVVALQMEDELDRITSMALERGAVAIGIGLLRAGYEEQLRSHSRGDLLYEVAEGRLEGNAAGRRAATLGFPRRPGALLPLAAYWRPRAPVSAEWADLLGTLKAAFNEADRPALVGARGDSVLAVLDRGGDAEEAGTIEELKRVVERFHATLEKHDLSAGDVALAIGQPQRGWAGMPDALRKVDRAAHAGRFDSPSRDWIDARRTEVSQLLLSLSGSPELSAFVEERLGPLLEIGGDRGADLLHTLEVYLDRGGRKTEAARVLHVERQSLYHRLARIEEVLDVDLDDGDTALALHLAVRARRVTDSA